MQAYAHSNLDPHLDHVRTPDQDRARQAFVEDHAHRVEHARVFAFGVDHALVLGGNALGRREHRLHQHPRLVHESVQARDIGIEILDRLGRHAGRHRRLRHRRRDLDDQARVERLRNDVLGTEAQLLAAVGAGDDVARFGFGELGDRLHAGELHLLVDRGRADIERAAEDEGKAQHVVDLVREVRTPGGDDAVGAHRLGIGRKNLRIGVGEGENQRFFGHLRHHLGLEHAGGGQAEEDIGALDDVAQGACRGPLRVARLGRLHVGLAAFIDHALRIAHGDVLALETDAHHQVEAGDRRRAGTRAHQLDLADVLADHLQAVDQAGGGNDRGAVLVIVEDRNLHPLAQFLLDVEALGRLDVLEVDAAQRGLQRRDDVDQLVRVVLGQFDVEDVDAGELLEQAALAFHHRLGGQRADVAQAQHGGAVGDHAHQVAARGVLRGGVIALVEDGHAGGRHAGGVGQGQVVLVGQGLGRGDRDFAGGGIGVVIQRQLGEGFVHGI